MRALSLIVEHCNAEIFNESAALRIAGLSRSVASEIRAGVECLYDKHHQGWSDRQAGGKSNPEYVRRGKLHGCPLAHLVLRFIAPGAQSLSSCLCMSAFPGWEIPGVINCLQNITAHKAIEEDLRRKHQEREDFFENSAIGRHIVSGTGIVQRANKAELALLGYMQEEYVGRHIAEFHVDAPVNGDILHRLSRGEQLECYPARPAGQGRLDQACAHYVERTPCSRRDDQHALLTRRMPPHMLGRFAVRSIATSSASRRRDSTERLPIWTCTAHLCAAPTAAFAMECA